MPYDINNFPKYLNKLPEGARNLFIRVYNEVYGNTKDDNQARIAAWSAVKSKYKKVGDRWVPKVKGEKGYCDLESLFLTASLKVVDEEKRLVSGYATTARRDNSEYQEIVEQDAISEALPEYGSVANLREMHNPGLGGVGVVKSMVMDHKGLWILAKIVDDVVWNKIKEGVYKFFSIGFYRLKDELIDGINHIKRLRLFEISVVDVGANPDAGFYVFKNLDLDSEEDIMAKGRDKIRLKTFMLTTEQREALSDECFALPEKRLYPFTDADGKVNAEAIETMVNMLNNPHGVDGITEKERKLAYGVLTEKWNELGGDTEIFPLLSVDDMELWVKTMEDESGRKERGREQNVEDTGTIVEKLIASVMRKLGFAAKNGEVDGSPPVPIQTATNTGMEELALDEKVGRVLRASLVTDLEKAYGVIGEILSIVKGGNDDNVNDKTSQNQNNERTEESMQTMTLKFVDGTEHKFEAVEGSSGDAPVFEEKVVEATDQKPAVAEPDPARVEKESTTDIMAEVKGILDESLQPLKDKLEKADAVAVEKSFKDVIALKNMLDEFQKRLIAIEKIEGMSRQPLAGGGDGDGKTTVDADSGRRTNGFWRTN